MLSTDEEKTERLIKDKGIGFMCKYFRMNC